MAKLFDIVYQLLMWLSAITSLTYREVNVVIYFIVIPAFFFYLLTKITKQKKIILGFLMLVIVTLFIIPDFEQFSIRLFDLSVDFLNWFDIIGLDYVQASVVICVFLPILMIAVLLYYLNKRNKT